MAVKVKDVIKIIEDMAPLETMEEWDNSGLNIGNYDDEVKGILLCLDVSMDQLREAKDLGCNLVISHHPMIFSGIKNLRKGNPLDDKIFYAIDKGINLYSSHTNLDKAKGGMNDNLMDLLDLKDYEVLSPSDGIGRIGRYKAGKSISLKEILELLRERLKTNIIRYTGFEGDLVTKIATINGSGSDYVDLAVKEGADLVITGDLKYHDMQSYKEKSYRVIDAGHFASEAIIFRRTISKVLHHYAKENNIRIIESRLEEDPFKI